MCPDIVKKHKDVECTYFSMFHSSAIFLQTPLSTVIIRQERKSGVGSRPVLMSPVSRGSLETS